jgi:uncharacterized membrane protein YcaP (DUF421 family)
MDPLRLVLRAAFVYFYLLILVRLSGKRTVSQGTTVEFVLALVFADLVDDAVWAEVPLPQFVVASATLFGMRFLLGVRS